MFCKKQKTLCTSTSIYINIRHDLFYETSRGALQSDWHICAETAKFKKLTISRSVLDHEKLPSSPSLPSSVQMVQLLRVSDAVNSLQLTKKSRQEDRAHATNKKKTTRNLNLNI